MFETVKRLYGKTQNLGVADAALAKGWITQDQYNTIIDERKGD